MECDRADTARENAVVRHYEHLLAPLYLWMVGGAEAAFAAADAELENMKLPLAGRLVLDLGAGFGAHAIPAARRGSEVVAIDASARLLRELERLRGGLPIHAVHDDLGGFARHLPRAPDVVLCMGDTLAHLPDETSVARVLDEVTAVLRPDGWLVLSFRDYGEPPVGTRRFIPVRSDGERILTCFLEYGAETVEVHDILHQYSPEGWTLRTSSYPKLRLSVRKVTELLVRSGLEVQARPATRGMVGLMARRANPGTRATSLSA